MHFTYVESVLEGFGMQGPVVQFRHRFCSTELVRPAVRRRNFFNACTVVKKQKTLHSAISLLLTHITTKSVSQMQQNQIEIDRTQPMQEGSFLYIDSNGKAYSFRDDLLVRVEVTNESVDNSGAICSFNKRNFKCLAKAIKGKPAALLLYPEWWGKCEACRDTNNSFHIDCFINFYGKK